MKKVVWTGIVVSLFVLLVIVFMRVRYVACVALNANRIAQISSALGEYLNSSKDSTTNMVEYILRNFPNIEVDNDQILDRNGRPARIYIEEQKNSYFIKVSSSGKDGVWGTKDDLKREGYLEKGK